MRHTFFLFQRFIPINAFQDCHIGTFVSVNIRKLFGDMSRKLKRHDYNCNKVTIVVILSLHGLKKYIW